MTPPVNRAPTLLLDLLVLHLSSFGIQIVNGTKFLSSTPFIWNKYHVRDTLPIYPPIPGTFDSMPVLPSPPRKPAFDAPFTLTTHLFPAAYLSTTRLTPFLKLPAVGATKEERRRLLGIPLILWNCVNRYVKNGLDSSNKTGLTIFFAHANGFPKEMS